MKKLILTLSLTALLALSGCVLNPSVSSSDSGSSTSDSGNVTPRPTPANVVELYQLAPNKDALMQSYVFKTKNNKLIVIDGGIDGIGSDADPYLPSALRSILCLEEGEYFEVEAWFLSHAHSDHYYELSKMLADYSEDSNYKINNFYFDFPDFDDYYAARGSLGLPSFNYTLSTKFNKFKQNLNKYANVNGIDIESESMLWYDDINGSTINSAEIKWGLDIEIDGIRFEIMQTWDYADRKGSEDINETSLVMRAHVEGQSILFLNDLGGFNSDRSSGARLVNTYGEALKSDIVQMAHHGQKGSQKALYDLVDAKVHLWPTPAFVWNYPNDYTHLVETRKWVNDGKDFVRGDAYNIVACLYEAYPKNPTKVADWNEVKDGMKITLPYNPEV